MKDERFFKVGTAGQEVHQTLNLSNFPNFHHTGSVEGMRSLYYGKDACLVQVGDYIYNVDEDTFQAAKDIEFLASQPQWLSDINTAMAEKQIQQLSSLYEQGSHQNTVMTLAVKSDLMNRMLDHINKSVTAARLAGPNAVGEMYVACKFNGEQKLIPLTQDDKKSLLDLSYDERGARLQMIAACELADPLFKSMKHEIGDNQVQATISTANAMDEDHILETADKISVVLQKFYSLHEADELTRIITDPEKTVEDVRQAMANIQQRDMAEDLLARISSATFLLQNDKDIALWVNIEGLQMPVKTLNEIDADIIRNVLNGDRSRLTEDEIQDMAKDLALTYYKDELAMNHDALQQLSQGTDFTLTEDDARTDLDFEKALEQKYPEGVSLHIDDLNMTDIYSYVQYGKLSDEDITFHALGEKPAKCDQYLQAEVVLPKEKLNSLVPSNEHYYDETYEDFINDLDNSEAYSATATELMHRHPNLDGARLTMYDSSMPKYLRVEGQPLDKSIAWILQNPHLEVAGLRTVLNDSQAAQKMLDDIRQKPFTEYERNWMEKMGMPKGLDMIRNYDTIYLFERGTLGFAQVDRMRGVRYNGDTMSRQAQDYINDFVLKKNMVTHNHHTFFMMPGAECEKKAYLDTMNNKLVNVDVQQDPTGRTLFTDGIKVLNEGDMQHFQDITGRITEARIHGIDRPIVRCKIDGVQQSGRDLTKTDRIKLGHYMQNTEEMKKFALSMAVKHFATLLYEGPEQKQSTGMKR